MTGNATSHYQREIVAIAQERTGDVHLVHGIAVPSSRGRGLVIAQTLCDRMIVGVGHENDDRLTCSDCESERLDA